MPSALKFGKNIRHCVKSARQQDNFVLPLNCRPLRYQVILPAPPLQPYIENYWLISGYWTQQELVTLMPHGNAILVFNLGEDIPSTCLNRLIPNEGLFLVGSFLHADNQLLHGQIRLLGITFRPGGFTHFYRHASMDQLTNQMCEFNQNMFPDLQKIMRYQTPYLDRFFLDRLSPAKYPLLHVVNDIEERGGQVKMGDLTKRHFITERQLERQFRHQIGVSPKEFIDLTRFKRVLAELQNPKGKKSLAEIAWDCGYYDHAHLTNVFKKYTGTAPSGLILSDFSKEAASLGE